MKPRILSTARLSLPLATAIAALLAAQSASASTFYWDNNATAAGFGSAGGTWAQNSTSGGTSARWKTDATGVASGSNTQATANTDIFNFGDGTNGLGAGTITVSGGVTMGNTNFGSLSGAIVLTGNTITFSAAPTITVNNTTNTINSIVAGAATSFTKAGSGNLSLGGANTFAGATTVSAGLLTLSNSLALQNSALDTTASIASSSATTGLKTTVATLTFGGLSGDKDLVSLFNAGNGYSSVTTLTLNPGRTVSYSGAIANGAMNLTKSGAGTQTLSGTNTYGGTTIINGGILNFANKASKTAAVATVAAAGSVGLGVKASDAAYYSATDVGDLFNSSLTGFTMNAASGVAIDTTNAGATFDQTVALTAARALTKLGTGTLSLSQTNTYSGTTTINEGTLALGVDHNLTGGLTFGTTAGTTTPGTLDLTSANATFAGPMLVNTNSATASEINIGAAQTLTINNNVQIGATTPAITGTVTNLTMNGGGTFNVATAAAGTFTIGGGVIGTISQVTTLDLTALKATTINTSTTGTLRVNPVSSGQSSSRGVLLLPTPSVVDTIATTTITAGIIAVGDSSTNTNNGAGNPIVMGNITLGTGLTALNVNTINVGTGGRDVGQIIYGSTVGDLMIRAADGSSRATAINIATGGATGSNTGNSRIDLSGHDADILVTSLNVGNQAKSGTVAIGTYEFNFGEQTTGVGVGSLASKLDATNVNIGFRTGTASVTSTMTSKVNLSGGTVTFGNVGATGTGVDIGNSTYNQTGVARTVGELNISGGNVTIHNGTGDFAVRLGQSSVANSGIVTASMNLTGGTTTLAGDLIRGTATGTVNSTLKLAGGTLDLAGNDIGATGAGAITLTAESGTLKNVATINGTGGLTKTTVGTLTMAGTNTYTGATDVNDGKLVVNGSISTSVLTTVASGATIAGSGTVGPLTVLSGGFIDPGNSPDVLDVDGNYIQAGTYNAEITSNTVGNGTTGYDQISVTGTVNITGGSLAAAFSGTGYVENNLLFILLNDDIDAITGTYATYAQGANVALYDGLFWNISYTADSVAGTFTGGNDIALMAVPEPRAALLGGLGLLALLRRRRSC
jgi:autotransporter-associated beta strand protein